MVYLFPLITVFIWAGNAIVNKLAASVIDPGAISFYRWLLSFICLTPFVIRSVWKNRIVIKQNAHKLATLAFFGLVLNQSLGYYAGQYTTATNIALISSLIPLMTLFISIKLLRQRLTYTAICGGLLSLLGLVFMLSHGDIKNLIKEGINKGDLLMLLAAICYALYCVLIKRWSIAVTNWQSVYIQGFFAVLMLFPLFIFSPHKELNEQTLPLITYAGLLASIIAPFCWIVGIQRLGADKAAMFMNVMPVLTAIIASAFFGEHLTKEHYIGITLALAGVMVSQLNMHKLRFKKKLI